MKSNQSSDFGKNHLSIQLKAITWLVIAAQLTTPANYAVAAVQDLYVSDLISKRLAATAQESSPVAQPAVFKPAPLQEPQVCLPRGFSDAPTDREFFAISVFAEPLVPMGGATTADENKDLAKALKAFIGRSDADDVSGVLEFLRNRPKSPWRVALLTDLGLFYRQNGYFTRALDALEDAWREGKDVAQPEAHQLVDRAVGELIQLNSRLGRQERLLSLFEEIKNRPMRGSATESVMGAREGLWGMKHEPGESFLCGPLAVGRIFKKLKPDEPTPACLRSAKSTSQGTSLDQIWRIANEAGLNVKMARREPGSKVIVPSVIHWKAGHFAALMEERDGRYFVRDATFGQDIWVSKEAIDDEGSGYFLVPVNGGLPEGWTQVGVEVGNSVWGKGRANNGDPSETKKNSKKCAGDCPPLGGMAGYSVNSLLVSLNIVDTPVGITPPFGPPLEFTVSYNQRDGAQSANFNYPNLGPKWSFSWLSYVIENSPDSSTSTAQYFPPGGGYETYNNPDFQGLYPVQATSRAKLQRIVDSSSHTAKYQLTFVDGSKAIFSQSDGAGTFRKWFMTMMLDPFGNALIFNYKTVTLAPGVSGLQLATVQAGTSGAMATLQYDAGDPCKIVKVIIQGKTASDTRSATLSYSGGELVQITDAVGMTSQFSYDANTTDFINALTTPYGRTTFSYLPYAGYTAPPGSPDVYDRWLVITDPLGEQKRIVYKVLNSGMPTSETPVPAGINITSDPTEGQYLEYRNTFYWDRNAMATMPDPNNPDWTKAHIYHWLHLGTQTESGYAVAAGVLESEKDPLETRVWYAYPGQVDSRYLPDPASGITQPIKIARVLDDGTTQLYQYTYNDLAQPTSFVDPAGRRTTFVYDANLIDLLEVHQFTSSGDQLLSKVTYNSVHQPLTLQDTTGQRTQFQYNTRGQMTQITDAKGAITSMTYDSLTGFLQSILKPDVVGAGLTVNQRTLNLTPDNYFRVQTVSDGDNYSMTFDYDNLDRMLKTTYPDLTTEQVIYQKLDPVLVKDRMNRWSGAEYDALGRAIVVRDAQQRTTRFDYCSCGSLASVTDPNGATTAWLRDLQGRVVTKVFPDNSRVNYAYENRTSRLKSVTDALGQTVTYTYLVDNNLSTMSYSGGTIPTPTVTFTYDSSFNRLTTMRDGVGLTTYEYKPIIPLSSPPTSGELTAALGVGRLQSVDGPFPNDTIIYGYDELGRVSSRSIGGIVQTATFDALGRITGVNNALDNFSYSYDNASGRLKTMSRTAGQVLALTYYTATGSAQNQQRIQTILNKTSSGTGVSQFDYGYTADGSVNLWTNKLDGSTAYSYYTFGYDSANQLLSAVSTNSGSPATWAKEFGYTYDPAGNRMTEYATSNSLSTNTLQYNNLNELTNRMAGERVNFLGSATDASTPVTANVAGSPAVMNGSSFNGYGIASSNSPVVPIVARDNLGNRATNLYWVTNLVVGGTNQIFAYDLNGNLLASGSGSTTNAYEWDAANRLTAVERVTSGALVSRSEFTYDGLGRRVKIVEKDNSGTVTSTKYFVWSGAQLCQERDSSPGSVTKQYFAQGEVTGGVKYYYTRDHLGSIREVTSASGTVLARYDYDPYGARTKTGSFDCDFGFTGHYYHSPSGLFLTLYRAYDPSAGRWLSRDPLGEMGGLNLYEYGLNNPINAVDRDGRNPLIWLLGAAVVVLSVAALYYHYTGTQQKAKANNQIDTSDPDQLAKQKEGAAQMITEDVPAVAKEGSDIFGGPMSGGPAGFPSGDAVDAAINIGIGELQSGDITSWSKEKYMQIKTKLSSTDCPKTSPFSYIGPKVDNMPNQYNMPEQYSPGSLIYKGPNKKNK